MPNGSTILPNLRAVMHEQYESLPDAQLADVLARRGVSAIEAENWLSNIGRTFQQLAPGIGQGALSGAMGGAALGPWGMLGGAVLGGLGGAMGGGRGGAGAPAPAAPSPAGAPTMPQPSPVGGAPAAGSLLQLLGNPSVQQALFSMLLGPRVGRESIPVGESGVEAPVAAFAELLREAADQALDQYENVGGADVAESLPDYLAEARDRGADTGNALVRGVILAKLLEQPAVGYVPVAPIAAPAPVVYAPAPATPAAGGAPGTAAPAAPVVPGGFEPVPTYSTPDLGIGQPIQVPTQSEAMMQELVQHRFSESLDEIFELNGQGS